MKRVSVVIFCGLLVAGCGGSSDDTATPVREKGVGLDVDFHRIKNRVVLEAYDNAIASFDKALNRAGFDKVGDQLLQL